MSSTLHNRKPNQSNGHSTNTTKSNNAGSKENPYGVNDFIQFVCFPLFIMTTTPIAAVVMWMLCAKFDGSIYRFATEISVDRFIELWPSPSWTAAKIIGVFALLEAILQVAIPGETFLGPVTPAGNRPSYKLNGIPAYFATHIILGAAAYYGLYDPVIVYDNLGSIIQTLSVGSYVICFLLYLKGHYAPSSTDSGTNGSFIMDVYWGVELHPAIGSFNIKQYANCRLGMMCWSPLLCFYAYKQYAMFGYVSNSMILSTVIQVVYIIKFYHWESGYFGSLDIMHDRFGYYIYWGVTVWIPSVYTSVGLYLVNHPNILPQWYFYGVLALGVGSVIINYQADAQRQEVRASQGKSLIWGKKPETILAKYTTADGKSHENLLLLSGWWGVARHFHYVPELMLSLAWTLPALFENVLPYFYVVYLTMLLTHRAGRDEVRCATKYGTYWTEYSKKVQYRMIPGIW
jgi:7-dehydrocholesterol reductase